MGTTVLQEGIWGLSFSVIGTSKMPPMLLVLNTDWASLSLRHLYRLHHPSQVPEAGAKLMDSSMSVAWESFCAMRDFARFRDVENLICLGRNTTMEIRATTPMRNSCNEISPCEMGFFDLWHIRKDIP